MLTCRLKKAKLSGAGDRVTLVKTAGDRGRDVLVYREGQLVELVQCKNQGKALSKPALMRELIKVALHGFKDPSLLGERDAPQIRYEIWCSGDFSEPCATLVDKWPEGWLESDVRPLFNEVREVYAQLAKIKWSDVKEYLLDVFPKRLSLHKVNAIDLSIAVVHQPTSMNIFRRRGGRKG